MAAPPSIHRTGRFGHDGWYGVGPRYCCHSADERFLVSRLHASARKSSVFHNHIAAMPSAVPVNRCRPSRLNSKSVTRPASANCEISSLVGKLQT